ncbi:hypothetical protein [Streptomyces sp. AM6-12]|uniref:hypothetical protein n=1 Tax=Streptomyces sp. AM6-12 TaxID=3345149 RepID=UPI00379BBC80
MTAIPPGRSRPVTALCALAVTGAAVLTGCGGDPDAGTNGVGKLSADRIQARTRSAARAASAVRLSGTVVTSGVTYRLDMRLKDDGGTGSVTSGADTFKLLRVGTQLYLKADAAFWSQADGKGDGSDGGAAAKLDGKYVKVPQQDPAYKKFSGFTDKDVLLSGLLTLHGSLATDGRHTEAGTPTVRITGDHGSGGTLDVSLKGTPYPLALTRAGNAGTLRFSDWGGNFTVTEPADSETVDYGRQLPTS